MGLLGLEVGGLAEKGGQKRSRCPPGEEETEVDDTVISKIRDTGQIMKDRKRRTLLQVLLEDRTDEVTADSSKGGGEMEQDPCKAMV